MSANLSLVIPPELKQYQLLNEEGEDCLMNYLFDFYLNTNEQSDTEIVEYYSATGELLKRSLYEENSLKKDLFFINGRIGSEKEFDKNKVGAKKTFDKDGNVICTTLYIYRNDFIIGIIKKKSNNEYKISYSYDEAKRIINRSIHINQELVNKQVYSYDRDNRVVEYRDNNHSINVYQRTSQNKLERYVITDILGNKIEVCNHFENGDYTETEIILNEHRTIIKDVSYVNNMILQKPQADDNDLDMVISSLYKPEESYTSNENKIDIISEFLKNKESINNVLPITIRKHALVI